MEGFKLQYIPCVMLRIYRVTRRPSGGRIDPVVLDLLVGHSYSFCSLKFIRGALAFSTSIYPPAPNRLGLHGIACLGQGLSLVCLLFMLPMEQAQFKYFIMPVAFIIYESGSIPLRICAST